VTITQQTMPQHLHFVTASTANGDTPVPTGNLMGAFNNAYRPSTQTLIPIDPSTISNVGGSQPHNNMAPYIAINFCIALQGIFPSPN
jgi:microcystin-dependent protein